jgi:hypothetical protein
LPPWSRDSTSCATIENSSADIVPFQSNSSHIPLSQREIHNRRTLLARCDERGDIAKLAPCVAAVPDDFNAMGRKCDVTYS